MGPFFGQEDSSEGKLTMFNPIDTRLIIGGKRRNE